MNPDVLTDSTHHASLCVLPADPTARHPLLVCTWGRGDPHITAAALVSTPRPFSHTRTTSQSPLQSWLTVQVCLRDHDQVLNKTVTECKLSAQAFGSMPYACVTRLLSHPHTRSHPCVGFKIITLVRAHVDGGCSNEHLIRCCLIGVTEYSAGCETYDGIVTSQHAMLRFSLHAKASELACVGSPQRTKTSFQQHNPIRRRANLSPYL